MLFRSFIRSFFHLKFACASLLAACFPLSCAVGMAQTLTPLCQPSVSAPIIVVTHQERLAAGKLAQPPLTDSSNGFAWPDTPSA
jgi:hypothetical protein